MAPEATGEMVNSPLLLVLGGIWGGDSAGAPRVRPYSSANPSHFFDAVVQSSFIETDWLLW